MSADLGRNSKFDFAVMYGESGRYFVANRYKYSDKMFQNICKQECDIKPAVSSLKEAAVRFGFGIDDSGERQNCWWLDFEHDGIEKGYCPVVYCRLP